MPPLHGAGDAVKRSAALLADDRLVLRVVRHWDDAGANRLFPSKSQIDPWVIGDDWANCALIDLHQRVERSTIVAVGDKLQPTPGWPIDGKPLFKCPFNALLGVIVWRLPVVVDKRGPLSVRGVASHFGTPILYRGVLLPLAEDGVEMDAVLVAANYRALDHKPRG